MPDLRRPKSPGESVFGLLMFLVSLVLFWQSYEISKFEALSSPGAFPMAASAVMAIASLIVVIGDLRKPALVPGPMGDKARAFMDKITPAVVIVFAGFVLGYAALLDTLGFLPASFLFLFAAIQFLHRGSVLFSFVVTLGSLIAIYAVFRLIFTVVLPEGVVPEREIMAWIEALLTGAEAK